MKASSKKGKHQVAGVGAIVFSVVIVAFLSGFYFLPYMNIDTGDKLSGVLLDNGDLYFGRLSYFPRLILHDAYTVLNAQDPGGYQIVPLENSAWAPDKIFLNYDKIVFIGDVGEDSEVMRIINQQRNQ